MAARQRLQDIENRSWKTKYHGPVLIHAAQQKAVGYNDLINDLRRNFRINIPGDLPTGGVVGMVSLVDCVEKLRSR